MNEIKETIQRSEEVINYIDHNLKTLGGDELSKAQVTLSTYFFRLCGMHEELKGGYASEWLKLRKVGKTEKEIDMTLIRDNETTQLYDKVKYLIRAMEKVLSALRARIEIKLSEIKTPTKQEG